MKTIEFSGNVKDGKQAPSRKKPSLKKRFKSVKLDTRDFKFDRNEANER